MNKKERYVYEVFQNIASGYDKANNRIIRPFYSLYFNVFMPLIGGGIRKRRQYRWLAEREEYVKGNQRKIQT